MDDGVGLGLNVKVRKLGELYSKSSVALVTFLFLCNLNAEVVCI